MLLVIESFRRQSWHVEIVQAQFNQQPAPLLMFAS
jgi:hypothetical protein